MMQPHNLFCQQFLPISFIYFPMEAQVLAFPSSHPCPIATLYPILSYVPTPQRLVAVGIVPIARR